MPLPDGDPRANQPWPPVALLPALDVMSEWAAWYSGDPDELQRVYTRIDQRTTHNGVHIRPSQRRGGLVGMLARTFWGRPPATTEPRAKLHVPLAADIATVSAELLFAEPISVTHPQKATQDKLNELVNDRFMASLIEGAEACSALGGVYLRTVWDRDVRPEGPWVSAIHADAAIPVWSYGRLREVTFYRTLFEDGNSRVVRWLEKHEKGAVFHGLYDGTLTTLGRAIPLTEMPETAPFAELVDQYGAIPTKIELLTASYVPNARPNRLWRTDPASAPLGRSDYAGVEGLFDAVDEVWSSLMRDIRLAKARIMVPDVYLQDQGAGQGASFDPEQEVFRALKMLPGKDQAGSPITLAQFDIRVEEHIRAYTELVRTAVTTAGYSEQSFSQAGDVAITATEVAARYRKSLSTRDRKILLWRPETAYQAQVLLQVGASSFGWKVDGGTVPEVVFPDAVQPDVEANARTIQILDAAKAISTKMKVILANPDRKDDEQWINKEVGAIHEENQIGRQFEDPGTFRGEGGTTQSRPGARPPNDAGDDDPEGDE